MARSLRLGACGTVLLVVFQSCLASQQATFVTAPAFVWGSSNYNSCKDGAAGLTINYEVLPASYLTDSIFGSLCSSKEQESSVLQLDRLAVDSERLVKLFIFGEVRREDLGQRGSTTSVWPLKELVEGAASALALPNMQSLDGQSLAAAVKAQTPALVELGSCDAGTGKAEAGDLAEQLSTVLAAEQGKLVALACGEHGVAAAAVAELQKALVQADRPFLIIYMGQPDMQVVAERAPARSLLADVGQSNVLCTGKCIVQVRLFEIIILLSILLSAIFTGLCMLHILDVPSKFEVDKKESTSRHE